MSTDHANKFYKKNTGICSAKPEGQVAPWKSKTRKVSLKKCLFKTIIIVFPPVPVKAVFSDPELNQTDPLTLGGYFPHHLVANITPTPKYSLFVY